MASSTKRPVYLDLIKIKLPIAGIMSIMHRLSGFFLVLVTPFMLYLLDTALNEADGFAKASSMLTGLTGKTALLLLLWAIMHHLLAGIRYLLLDIDIGIEKPFYSQSAWGVVIAAPVLAQILLTGLT